MDANNIQGISAAGAVAGIVSKTVQTCLKSNEPAIKYDHYQHQNSPSKDRLGSKNLHKPKYFNRCDIVPKTRTSRRLI